MAWNALHGRATSSCKTALCPCWGHDPDTESATAPWTKWCHGTRKANHSRPRGLAAGKTFDRDKDDRLQRGGEVLMNKKGLTL